MFAIFNSSNYDFLIPLKVSARANRRRMSPWFLL